MKARAVFWKDFVRLFGSSLFGRSQARDASRRLYLDLLAQSRTPDFYRLYGVPDTVDGRFDMLLLHVFLVLDRLKRTDGKNLAVALADRLFDDLDCSLREMGAGDLGVARRIRAMAEAYRGRLAAYGRCVREGGLNEAIARNLFGSCTEEKHQDWIDAIALYIERARQSLDRVDDGALLAGAKLDWPGLIYEEMGHKEDA